VRSLALKCANRTTERGEKKNRLPRVSLLKARHHLFFQVDGECQSFFLITNKQFDFGKKNSSVVRCYKKNKNFRCMFVYQKVQLTI
jgi:hypothetical protein